MSVCWTPNQPSAGRRQPITVRDFWTAIAIAFFIGDLVGLMVACVFAYGIHRLVAP